MTTWQHRKFKCMECGVKFAAHLFPSECPACGSTALHRIRRAMR